LGQQPYQSYRAGEEVLIRAVVVEPVSSALHGSVAVVRIEDFPSLSITTFAPLSEIARPAEVARLLLVDPAAASTRR